MIVIYKNNLIFMEYLLICEIYVIRMTAPSTTIEKFLTRRMRGNRNVKKSLKASNYNCKRCQ